MQGIARWLLAVVVALTVAAGCGSRPTAVTDAGDVTDVADVVCPSPDESGPCQPGGFNFNDEQAALACFSRCSSDADCTDPCQPYCSIQGLVEGGDYNCNGQIRVCRSLRQDDCQSWP